MQQPLERRQQATGEYHRSQNCPAPAPELAVPVLAAAAVQAELGATGSALAPERDCWAAAAME